MKYIASCSGGKDSIATIILAHENKEPLDEIVFAEVMFDEETSGELPEHIDFIKNKHFRCLRVGDIKQLYCITTELTWITLTK